MKKAVAVLLIVVIAAISILQLTAYATNSSVSFVADIADLLSNQQWNTLERRAESLSSTYRCDVRIVIVENMWEFGYYDIEDFSYYLYSEYSFGYGYGRDCVLLVLSMDDRDYDLRVEGNRAHEAFTLYGIDDLLDSYVLPELGNNNYYQAFVKYLDRAEVYFQMEQDGRPFDSNSDPARGSPSIVFILVASLLPAFLICTMWKNQMKTARIARTASNYIPAGGFRLSGQGDIYLYRTTSRTRIQQSSSSSSSSGRASSRGSSSSGSSSSGRSGKF